MENKKIANGGDRGMRECSDCEWMQGLEDSEGRWIYFCMNADSGAYLEETGICGNCDLEGESE